MKSNDCSATDLVIGIDATNLRRGGGVTHLIELLRAVKPSKHGIAKVVVWSCAKTLAALDDHPWLQKEAPRALEQGLFMRTFWQRYSLPRAARDAECDLLFVPGGAYSGNFRPVVTMSRNLLPFEVRELKRYGRTVFTLKLLLLRWVQSRTFRSADGVIFLTKYAQEAVLKVSGCSRGKTVIIPHGLNSRFRMAPKPQRPIQDFDPDHSYRLLYVSIIDQYKHQWHIVEAVDQLRRETGWPLTLDLVGPDYPPALQRFNETLSRLDPRKEWVRYHGAIPYEELHPIYEKADLGVFASSCENMPNILLETMASGLPIACSNRGPMPEVLGDAGIYFDPEQPAEIASALQTLISSPELRLRKAEASYRAAQGFTWGTCAESTFSYLTQIITE